MNSDPIVIRVPRSLAYGLAIVLTAALTLGAATILNRGSGSPAQRVDAYLSALQREDARAAWPLLTQRVRTIWGSFDAFEAAVHDSDWSTFQYAIAGSSCDDSICAVDLLIPNGVDSVPTMLYQGPTHYWWGAADSLIFSDFLITGGTEEARQRGDTMARMAVSEWPVPWMDSGIE